MTDDTILSHAETLAEIKRLHRANLDLAALLREQGCQMLDIRARVTELEAENLRASLNSVLDQKAELLGAIARGTLAAPTPDVSARAADSDDQPATYTHDVPPNAPR